jgi:hypothetical protein
VFGTGEVGEGEYAMAADARKTVFCSESRLRYRATARRMEENEVLKKWLRWRVLSEAHWNRTRMS